MLLHVFVQAVYISLIRMKKSLRGNPKLDEVRNRDITAANAERVRLADEHGMVIMNAIHVAQNQHGHMTLKDYAAWLNDQGYRTRRNSLFTAAHIRRLFDRFLTARAQAKVKAKVQSKPHTNG